MQQTTSYERIKQQTDAKSYVMETTEKIQAGLKSELRSGNNPFIEFANRIKKTDNQNFIVEWQLDEIEIRKTNENLAANFIFF